MSEESNGPWVPEILTIGTRGVRAKIWTFLFVNETLWFTAKEITGYLDMLLSKVQLALKDLRRYAPRIVSINRDRLGKGRPEKKYTFQRIEHSPDQKIEG